MPYPAVPHRAAGSIELDAMVCEAVFVVRLRNAPQPNSDSLQHQLTCSAAIWIGSVFLILIVAEHLTCRTVTVVLNASAARTSTSRTAHSPAWHCQINLSRSTKPEAGRAITLPRLHSAIR